MVDGGGGIVLGEDSDIEVEMGGFVVLFFMFEYFFFL